MIKNNTVEPAPANTVFYVRLAGVDEPRAIEGAYYVFEEPYGALRIWKYVEGGRKIESALFPPGAWLSCVREPSAEFLAELDAKAKAKDE